MRFQLRIADLPVEMTRARKRRGIDLGGAEIHETPDKPEGPLRPKQLDRCKVAKLPTQAVHPLLQPQPVAFDLLINQRPFFVAGEQRVQVAQRLTRLFRQCGKRV